MNITLSIDEKLAEQAREVARRQGTSLNALVRQYIQGLVGQRSNEHLAQQLERLWNENQGHSGGQPIRREDAYQGRL